MNIRNSVVLVTGANRGIGRAFVESLLDRGASHVYAGARRLSDLDWTRSLDSSRITPIELDVTLPASIESAAAQIPGISLLINNAGVLDFGSVLDAPLDAFRRNLDVNFYGPLQTSRAFAPALAANHGAVVNVLTVVALASMPSFGVYNASKSAAWSLTQSLRADLARRGVKVFAVFPGPVDTDMARGIEMSKATPLSVANEVLDGIEAGAEDIFPDPVSKQVFSAWSRDPKAVERQFASM